MKTIFSQRTRFLVSYLRRYRMQLVVAPMIRRILNRGVVESFDGIKIVDFSARRGVDQRFQTETVAALRLIKTVDPRRFNRLQREIEFITNCEAVSWAVYDRPLKSCEIDYYGCFKATDDPEWYRWYYAAILIHEATHGAVFSRRVDYAGSLRSRIERLCHTEAKRFATRADTGGRMWSEVLVGKFDERHWLDHWRTTFFQRAARLRARLREARQNLPK